jgi:hypothetical protein
MASRFERVFAVAAVIVALVVAIAFDEWVVRVLR